MHCYVVRMAFWSTCFTGLYPPGYNWLHYYLWSSWVLLCFQYKYASLDKPAQSNASKWRHRLLPCIRMCILSWNNIMQKVVSNEQDNTVGKKKMNIFPILRSLQIQRAPKDFFLHFCHRWSFGSLPLSPLACLVGDISFLAILSTWLHRYYLNWTELDNDINESIMNCLLHFSTHYFPV